MPVWEGICVLCVDFESICIDIADR
jgi:hypothetical protein